jgi:hypothetical protein
MKIDRWVVEALAELAHASAAMQAPRAMGGRGIARM